MAFRSLPHGASAEASLEPRAWGSDVSVQVRGFRPGTLCQVWLRRADGTRVPAGSFRYVYDGESDEAGLSSAVTPRRRHRDRPAGRLQDLRGAVAVWFGGRERIVDADNQAEAREHLMRPSL